MLKQGTKLVTKLGGKEYHIGAVCGELYFPVNSYGVGISPLTENELLRTFTIIEEKWEPKDGGKYWYIDSSGDICATWWQENKHDLFRRDYLGIYQTKEEAQTARENMKKIS